MSSLIDTRRDVNLSGRNDFTTRGLRERNVIP